jgi:hypothetical protein
VSPRAGLLVGGSVSPRRQQHAPVPMVPEVHKDVLFVSTRIEPAQQQVTSFREDELDRPTARGKQADFVCFLSDGL